MPQTTIELPALSREAHLRAETVDEAARTVEIIWTVRRQIKWDIRAV